MPALVGGVVYDLGAKRTIWRRRRPIWRRWRRLFGRALLCWATAFSLIYMWPGWPYRILFDTFPYVVSPFYRTRTT
jgi:hypothetical protein